MGYIANKYKLPNGNTLLWLGKWKTDVIDNVLILAGGDVLLLKSICHIRLINSDVRNDLLNLTTHDFIKKYKLDIEECEGVYYDIIPELKKGLKSKEYPAFAEDIDLEEIKKKPKERIRELEDLAKERFIGKDGINMADYLTSDEYEELLELYEKLI